MEKKEYISPLSEVMNLRAMQAMMDETPLFGPASYAKQPFAAPASPTKKTEVF